MKTATFHATEADMERLLGLLDDVPTHSAGDGETQVLQPSRVEEAHRFVVPWYIEAPSRGGVLT